MARIAAKSLPILAVTFPRETRIRSEELFGYGHET